MNRNSSAWTGRAARTLQDAFGPYTSRKVYPKPEPKRGEGWFVALCLACFVLGFYATYWRT